jgi:hypothetical protein
MTRRLLPLAVVLLLSGCGAPYTLTVRNDYPFPVEVIQRQAGDRLSRQDEPLGTVPPGAEKTFTGGHPYVSDSATLAIVTEEGKTLREIHAADHAGFTSRTDGRKTTATLRVGPHAGP